MDLTYVFVILGFMLATYSVIANDSVQTLGTFIASNSHIRWYWLWLGASSVLIFTLIYGWVQFTGDISFGRLNKIPHISIEWYHLLGPMALFVLTRLGIPVSTTFMVLSLFASSLILEKMLIKSFVGYVLAAVSAFALWWLLSRFLDEHLPVNQRHAKYWRTGQWLTTGFLWFTWLSHDMANIAVFLPRNLSINWLVFVILFSVSLLAYIFFCKGGKIQNIILEKTNTRYVRSATIIDLCFALLLLFFKEWNDIPMSTTWVFVGLLCGREIAIFHLHKPQHMMTVFPIVLKDFFKMMVGLSVSVGMALIVHNFFAS